MIHTLSAPWNATLTPTEYLLTLYFLVVAGLALFAGVIRTLTTQGEVGSRYRSATVARLSVSGLATVSYIAIIATFLTSYHRTAAGFVPSTNSVLILALRYMDWSITVPLLCVELLSVCLLAGAVARSYRAVAMAGSFLMIFTGFIGAFLVGDGVDKGAMFVWGAISCVFWVLTSVVLIRAVRGSFENLTPEASRLLRNAAILLLSGWVVYPVVYIIQALTTGGKWATTIQILLCIADVTVKIGLSGTIHRIAKLRTAEDVRAGDDVHSESIWISSVKQSDAGLPREVYLATDAAGHFRRPKPPTNAAVAAEEPEEDDAP